MKKNHFLKLSLLSLLLINSRSYSHTDSIPVLLDAFNSFVISSSGFLPNSNLSIISGCPEDSFFQLPPYSSHLFYINADIGAESGEALLNRYSKPAHYPNRDHRTSYSMIMSVPKIPLSLIYKYLYTDEYSDRFDSIWAHYSKVTAKQMTYDEDGLRHEHLVAARYQKNNLLIQTKYNWYRRWNATPYFFSPLLSYGYSINPSLSYSTDAISILSDWFIDNHSEYYNHITPEKFTDLSFNNNLKVKISEGISANLQIQLNQKLDPESFLSAGLTQKNSPFHWNITGSVYNNYETSIKSYGSYHFNANLNCSLQVARNYLPKTRAYYFTEYNTPVSYEPISIRQTDLFASARYSDTLFLPFSITTWYQFNSDPLWESVTFKDDSVFIRQIPFKNNESVAGVKANCHFNFKSLHMDICPAFLFPLGNTQSRFSIQKLMDCKLSYIPHDSNSISGSITLKYRDRSTLNYIISDYEDPMQSFISPSLTSIYLNINVPFILPFVDSFVKNASIFVNAGPIRVSKEQRFLEHPLGNLIGPAIYAGIRGNFW